jgi:Mn-containing catalase
MKITDFIQMALDIEIDLEKNHQSLYYEVSDPKLKEFIQFLIVEDGSHINRINEFTE